MNDADKERLSQLERNNRLLNQIVFDMYKFIMSKDNNLATHEQLSNNIYLAQSMKFDKPKI